MTQGGHDFRKKGYVEMRAECAEDTTEYVHHLCVGHILDYRFPVDLIICGSDLGMLWVP